MSIPSELQHFLDTAKQAIPTSYKDYIHSYPVNEPRLQKAMEYSLLSGGKRLRPLLINLVGTILNVKQQNLNTLSLAVECIHAYSLIHDDLPSMDDDDLRRGLPTCHIKFDEATAILAGDALQCMAFDVLVNGQLALEDELDRIQLIKCLAHHSGARGMVAGQSIDLKSTNTQIDLSQLTQLHTLKTGAILSACVELPSIISNIDNSQFKKMKQFAYHVGLAFQIQDDILDVVSDTATLGKPKGSDTLANKSTFVSLLGLEGAQQALHENKHQALHALGSLNYNTLLLEKFVDYLVKRTF